MSGKGSTPRSIPDRAAYEANWDDIDWSARDGLQTLHGDTQAPGQEAGAGEVQPPTRAHVPTEARG